MLQLDEKGCWEKIALDSLTMAGIMLILSSKEISNEEVPPC